MCPAPFPITATASGSRVLQEGQEGMGNGTGTDPCYLKGLNHLWAELWRGHCTRQPHACRQKDTAHSLSALLTGAARDVKSEGRQKWSGRALRWVIPWEEWDWTPPVGELWSRSSQSMPALPSDTLEVLHICLSVLFRKGSLPLR